MTTKTQKQSKTKQNNKATKLNDSEWQSYRNDLVGYFAMQRHQENVCPLEIKLRMRFVLIFRCVLCTRMECAAKVRPKGGNATEKDEKLNITT